MMTTEPINFANHAVRVDGEIVGHVLHYPIGVAPGWYFVAAHKRFTNRYPDSETPAPAWRDALPR